MVKSIKNKIYMEILLIMINPTLRVHTKLNIQISKQCSDVFLSIDKFSIRNYIFFYKDSYTFMYKFVINLF